MADNLLSSYQFHLPPELIAQHPAPARDASRLLRLAADGALSDHLFRDLPDLLAPGDLLVRNNVRVLPARLLGQRQGGGRAELLLVRRDHAAGDERWLCLARPANRFKPGREFSFGDGRLVATASERGEQGMVWVSFSVGGDAFLRELERCGRVPLPPYISRPDRQPTPEDAERYQTVYASRPGAVAAPTAGLHFTAELDARLAERGVGLAEITLNVGPGTFRPIQAASLDDHRMDAEWYEVPAATEDRLRATRAAGGRVVAVGTTTARTLEAAAGTGRSRGWTELFIRPGHRFAALDGLITNFHLPGSSLLVLISALAGRERVLASYRRAVAERYRFYSFGDAMLIWRPERTP
ncbi:MAG: tRNA preQ1(34) S-adenosylmethionine ribosyltransferase-isomerase QueA [Planctomycetes bacterium]|nr:tRNA preQ1(34) S-adenosylmethionine ribosyltransferase-isomerase QueA [Planctomycetota bacterium]